MNQGALHTVRHLIQITAPVRTACTRGPVTCIIRLRALSQGARARDRGFQDCCHNIHRRTLDDRAPSQDMPSFNRAAQDLIAGLPARVAVLDAAVLNMDETCQLKPAFKHMAQLRQLELESRSQQLTPSPAI